MFKIWVRCEIFMEEIQVSSMKRSYRSFYHWACAKLCRVWCHRLSLVRVPAGFGVNLLHVTTRNRVVKACTFQKREMMLFTRSNLNSDNKKRVDVPVHVRHIVIKAAFYLSPWAYLRFPSLFIWSFRMRLLYMKFHTGFSILEVFLQRLHIHLVHSQLKCHVD